MAHTRRRRTILAMGWWFGVLVAVTAGLSAAQSGQQKAGAPNPDDYAGNDSCKTCHTEEYTNFLDTPHARATESHFKTDMSRGCESCHGPAKAHVLSETKRKEAMDTGAVVPDYEPGLVKTYTGVSPKAVSENCLSCHAGMGEEHINYKRGEHWRNDVGCTDCHDPHGMPRRADRLGSSTFADTATRHKPDWGSEVMLKTSEPKLCVSCHSETKGQFTMPFRHRVLEGEMSCSDCHNPHGGFESRQTRLAVGVDAACAKCHTDKQGPFAFEHAPLKLEGCTACHTPHGSPNPRMLRRADVFQLCIECHSDVGTSGAPNTPSFHNLAQEKWRNCTTCHAQIHGSQSHPLFFR